MACFESLSLCPSGCLDVEVDCLFRAQRPPSVWSRLAGSAIAPSADGVHGGSVVNETRSVKLPAAGLRVGRRPQQGTCAVRCGHARRPGEVLKTAARSRRSEPRSRSADRCWTTRGAPPSWTPVDPRPSDVDEARPRSANWPAWTGRTPYGLAPRSCRGMATLQSHRSQFEYCHPRYAEASTGVTDMPESDPNNEEPATGLDTAESNTDSPPCSRNHLRVRNFAE